MRATCLVILVGMLSVQAGCGGREKAAEAGPKDAKPAVNAPHGDVKKIQGTWRIVSLYQPGRPVKTEDLESARVIITPDTLTVKTGEDDPPVTYRLDPLQEPRAIDLFIKDDVPDKAVEKTHVSPGIYHLDGNDLKICWSMEQQAKKGDDGVAPQRPRAFVEGRDTILLILKRE